jgi:tRNA G10  N-methylase Trm11
MVEDAVGKEPGLVVDPFAGSGTTLGEALRLGHRAIGVEINFFAATLTKEVFAKRHNELADTYRVITSEALSEKTLVLRGFCLVGLAPLRPRHALYHNFYHD